VLGTAKTLRLPRKGFLNRQDAEATKKRIFEPPRRQDAKKISFIVVGIVGAANLWLICPAATASPTKTLNKIFLASWRFGGSPRIFLAVSASWRFPKLAFWQFPAVR
jgi:hypothetical protein